MGHVLCSSISRHGLDSVDTSVNSLTPTPVLSVAPHCLLLKHPPMAGATSPEEALVP